MDRLPNDFVPIAFITGTYRNPRTRDDIAIDTRKYTLRASRRLKRHISPEIGYKEFDNSHFHMTLFSNDPKVTDADIKLLQSKELWGFGRIEAKRWENIGGLHYTLKHKSIPMVGEVFCPCQKRSCRKNRCKYQIEQRRTKNTER